MRKMLNINNYVLDKPLTSDNSGFSKWGIGKKGGYPYFIKEFLSPVYPADDTIYSEDKKQGRIALCQKFVNEKKELYSSLREVSDGHIVCVEQFFRIGAKYYISTEAIQGREFSVEEIARLPFEERLRLCCQVAHAMAKVHGKSIVHADIKPDNVLVIKKKKLQSFIIDFDCSFFETQCPKLGEELNGDMVYLSPEGFLHIAGIESQVSCKMDVFALGLLFCQYLTGKMPKFDHNEYQYAYESVLDDNPLDVSEIENVYLRFLIGRMLESKPEARPDMQSVFSTLNCILLGILKRDMPERVAEKSVDEGFFTMAGNL